MSKPSATARPSILARWLPVALVCIGLTIFTGAMVQQNYRQSADDPQIQMAEDTAAALNQGTNPSSLVLPQKLDREHSLAPFVIIVNKQLQIVASDAAASTDSALPPAGVFSNASAHGEQHITWQTAQGVRYAAVVTPTSTGYVVAARSLKQVELREDILRDMTAVAMLGLLLVTLLATALVR